jgi:cell division protein FtsL
VAVIRGIPQATPDAVTLCMVVIQGIMVAALLLAATQPMALILVIMVEAIPVIMADRQASNQGPDLIAERQRLAGRHASVDIITNFCSAVS